MNELSHICVCICTYKRPSLLKRLLDELGTQETSGLFTYSIVVADNDALRSAESIVLAFSAASIIPITYCMEPRQNISLARNKAIEHANGDYVAFIDDDEFPVRRWLLTLYMTIQHYNVAGVLGPVKCYFEEKPPAWIIDGKFYERCTYPTGFVIDWTQGRTGNVLLKKSVFQPGEQHFSQEFHRAGDQDFFRRMIAKGHVFMWCNEAHAYEVVPRARWTRTFMLKRALLRGTICVQHPTFGPRSIAKSLVAVPLYTLALPVTLVLGQGKFMNVLVRLFDHLGKLLTCMGMRPVKNQLITD